MDMLNNRMVSKKKTTKRTKSALIGLLLDGSHAARPPCLYANCCDEELLIQVPHICFKQKHYSRMGMSTPNRSEFC